MKKIYFIYNPYSGKGTIKTKAPDIINVLTAAGYEVTVRPTQCQLDASETAMRICSTSHSEYDMILCSGGDGTLNEVISGIMQSEHKLPIAYIPSGTTNDFARSLNIPDDPDKALSAILSGQKVPVDIGGFNDRKALFTSPHSERLQMSHTKHRSRQKMYLDMLHIFLRVFVI